MAVLSHSTLNDVVENEESARSQHKADFGRSFFRMVTDAVA